MISKTYGEAVVEYNIEIPSEEPRWKDFLLEINKDKSIIDCRLDLIEDLQKMPKKHPKHDNINRYCLYLGTHENVDLYSFHQFSGGYPDYSTGIVFGDEPSDYCSGWPMNPLVDDPNRQMYSELFKRELLCGLLSDKVKGLFLEEIFSKDLDALASKITFGELI